MKRKSQLFIILCFVFIVFLFLGSCEFMGPKTNITFQEIVWVEGTPLKAYAKVLEDGKAKEIELSLELVERVVSCVDEGYETYLAKYTLDGNTYEDTYTLSLSPSGHDYDLYQVVFSTDYTNATAYFFCNNDSAHTAEVNVLTTVKSSVSPTCEKDGKIVYQAEFDYENKHYEKEEEVIVPALGHDYSQGSYELKELDNHEYAFVLSCHNGCGEKVSVNVFTTSEIIHPTETHGKLERTTYYADYNGRHLEKVVENVIDIDQSFISGFNTMGEVSGFAAGKGLRLFSKDSTTSNSRFHYLLIKEKSGNYQVVDKGFGYLNSTLNYDYAIISLADDAIFSSTNINDLILFKQSINGLLMGDVQIYFSSIASNVIHIDYDLGYELYETKDDLYRAFFSDYYSFLKEVVNLDFSDYGISDVNDFLIVCKTWDAYGRSEMAGLGNAFGRFYLDINVGGTFEDQTPEHFIGWCYQQGKYIDFLHHLEIFFGYWRTDEGYVRNDPNGADFFASSWAAFVDTCKFFYFTSSTLTQKYAWFTEEKSARVHYMLDHLPNIGAVSLPNNELNEITLPLDLTRDNYEFLGWYDINGKAITKVNTSTKVYAKWHHIERTITFVSNGKAEQIISYDGYRIPKPNFKLANHSLTQIIDVNGNPVDPLDPVSGDNIYYCIWERHKEKIVSIRIYGFNMQGATSEVSAYNGMRMYEPGVSLDASLYWYKIGVTKSGNSYYISSLAASGEATPTNFDYLLLVFSGDNTNSYATLITKELSIGQQIVFDKDPSTLSKGEVNLNFTVYNGEESCNNLILVVDDVNLLTNYDQTKTNQKLPTLLKNGYTFLGWYDQEGNEYTEVNFSGTLILYSVFEEKTYDNVLDYVSDVVTSYTMDQLPYEFNGENVTWESTNTNLYKIIGNVGQTSRLYQTHQNQTVTVKARVGGATYSKKITIAPVLYDTPEHPLATYFSVSSASSYTRYSTRYASTNELFSDKFKTGFDFVYYAFAIPELDGSLTINDRYIDQVMALKENGIRVTFVIDGANSSALKNLVRVCDNQTTRTTFINNICQMLVQYGFDGVDIDWEFPGTLSSTSGFEKYTTSVDISNMNSLLRELRARMTDMQADGGTPYLLTVATPPTYWGTDRFDYRTINATCDYVNMMSYDLNKTSTTSHLTHVHIPANNYSYQFSCEYGINYYSSLGLSKSKIILGAAAYGKAYKVTGTVNMNATCPALGVSGTLGQVQGYGLALQSVTWASGTIYYHGIKTLMDSGNFKKYTEYNNGKVVGSYLYSPTDQYFITFDSVESLIAKCEMAESYQGMGIMMWAYGEDATDTITNTLADRLG